MWLINTSTLRLKEFPSGTNCPFPYAILSHRWGPISSEVSFQEMIRDDRLPETVAKPGFDKIVKTCELARTWHGLKWAWLDTCCINKLSSAELSEAINSMFVWESLWFTRGWTLQEMIAPKEVIFFDGSWTRQKSKLYDTQEISDITGIATGILDHSLPLADIPVAVRMSWAAERKTTREEDIAYCLLGIFDVNMPMLYGEGKKAFLRLQEEIIKQTPDLSIFAWTAPLRSVRPYTGLLAEGPDVFSTARDFESLPEELDMQDFTITNLGIRLRLPVEIDRSSGHLILPMNICSKGEKGRRKSIFLRQSGTSSFVRALPDILVDEPHYVTASEMIKSFLIIKRLLPHQVDAMEMNVLGVRAHGIRISKAEPVGSWDFSRNTFFAGCSGAFVGYLHFAPEWAEEFDSFVFVCHFNRYWSTSPWNFHLVCGDDWRDIQPRFVDHYRLLDNDGVDFGNSESILALQHLYHHPTEVPVTGRAKLAADGRTTSYEIHIEDQWLDEYEG